MSVDANVNNGVVESGMVSVIVPVFNRAHMIGTTVQSVLDQTYRPIELILVDDGSTDGTRDELNRLASLHSELIRVVHRENGGPGLARESGRLLACGEFIQYLDSDDRLMPRKFEVQVAALRAQPDCGIAYGRTQVIDPSGRVLNDSSKLTGARKDALFPALLVERWWHTHTPLYRRSVCDAIGPWPAQQPEDWDYDARAGALRVRLAYCDEVVSRHCHHGGQRVTTRPYELYLPQEAWFLPRLYDCAIRAGVARECPEMDHFSRWAFSLSRRVALRGMWQESERLLALAHASRCGTGLMLRLYTFIARIVGLAVAAGLAERMYVRFRSSENSQPAGNIK